jgi:cephalosporin hydroxylase
MGFSKGIVKAVLRGFVRYQGSRKLQQLRDLHNAAGDKIADAISASLKNNLTPDEKNYVDAIEALRKSLNSSSQEIKVTDYGAGSPSDNLTQEEMRRGLTKTITVSEACSYSKPYFWALMLSKLVGEFKPSSCIELGTCLGLSAAYQAAALRLSGKGSLTTLEGAESFAMLESEHLKQLGLENATVVSGRFQDNLDRVLKEKAPIDFAFIDGHHDEEATLTYFAQFIPYLSKQSVIIFDDISWSDGMRRAWSKIEKSDLVKISVNLRTIGICVLDANNDQKHSLKIPLLS